MELIKEKKLGFGCMRLPILDKSDPASFDYEQIEELFDAFLEKGFTYFDTAYTYHGYHAEEAVRKALVERHPRNSLFNWPRKCRCATLKTPAIWKRSSMNN